LGRKKSSENNENKGVLCNIPGMVTLVPTNIKELGDQLFDKEKVSQEDLRRYLCEESCVLTVTVSTSGGGSMLIIYFQDIAIQSN